ncbi:Alpha/Beta hydrolase protein [Parachaetomium inaequale]|uniref:Carboxylic ester hydrolase n=1 Tax=Parachaetomium inaequale TaxID=2588326 RepID=A0AAN6PLX0_9PEZI|nr:Alpha/Beta hydrolase protein [Parachaetomium inaequale]
MRCVPQINRRATRRTMLAWSWLSAAAVVLLLCFYLYGFEYGHRRETQSGSLLDVAKDGASRTTTSSTAMTTTKKASGPAATDPAVVLRQGTYVGTTLLASPRFPKAIEAFRGVPYAQDTAGQNRFRPPQPLPESAETFDAVAWGKICPAEGVVQGNMSENCLNANIYRPAGLVDRDGYEKTEGGPEKKRPRLPVVVYVHGGGFNTGHGTERNMASFVAWADAPMVAVNFNYRVGALGFLPSDVTAREGLLNLGLRDQQMLLGWVQDNIEAFGGDPSRVTIMGLSAGAHSIGHHVMYYARSAAKPPFVKAILESGATTARAVFYPTHPRHLVQFREFLLAAGAAGVPEANIFSHLRTLPLATIVRASKTVWDKYVDSVTWPFQPVIDGPNTLANSSHTTFSRPPLIPDLPINSWLSTTSPRTPITPIPIITGFNTNEGTSFIPANASTTADFRSFFQTLIPSLSEADLTTLETLYPDPVTDPSSPYGRGRVPRGMGAQWARLDAAYAHYAYICPVLQTAHYMSLLQSSSAGGGEGTGHKVYVYRYAATAANGTANHGDEAPVVAHDMEVLRGKVGMGAVAGGMHGRWARFVTSREGEPDLGSGSGSGSGSGGEGVEWPAFVSPFTLDGKEGGAGTGKIMVFGEGNDEMGGGRNKGVPARVVDMTPLEREACRFWWERVWLSEGLGRREGEGEGGGKAGARL